MILKYWLELMGTWKGKYIQFLKDNLIKELNEGENSFSLRRTSCHRSRATQQSLAVEGVIVLKVCLTQNRDLNIIEQMWIELKGRFCV